MLNIVLITVGKLDKVYWQMAAAEYLKRLQHDAKITSHIVREATTPNIANNIKLESAKIKAIADKYPGFQTVLLDLTGDLVTSAELAKIITNNQTYFQGKLLFIIGGSNGVSSELKSDPNIKKIAFGKITFLHQLCQVVLLEQIYRAFQIINNRPYHK